MFLQGKSSGFLIWPCAEIQEFRIVIFASRKFKKAKENKKYNIIFQFFAENFLNKDYTC